MTATATTHTLERLDRELETILPSFSPRSFLDFPGIEGLLVLFLCRGVLIFGIGFR